MAALSITTNESLGEFQLLRLSLRSLQKHTTGQVLNHIASDVEIAHQVGVSDVLC